LKHCRERAIASVVHNGFPFAKNTDLEFNFAISTFSVKQALCSAVAFDTGCFALLYLIIVRVESE